MDEAHAPVTVFGNPVSPRLVRKGAKMRRRFERKYGYNPDDTYPLVARENPVLGPAIGVQDVVSADEGAPLDFEKGVLVSTIRMGYGHYRIAMALASAANSMGYVPYWFDLLGFDTPGAHMIRDLDKWYSLASRVSQRSRLFNRLVWEPLTSKWYKRLEKNYPVTEAAHVFANIHNTLPKDMPVLGTHPFNTFGAVHAGMTNVVNVIPDNCPLGFHVAEGALQTVQGPANYFGFRTLAGMASKGHPPHGVPADRIALTGHYVDHELVANIDADCRARLDRMAAGRPRRLLLSIGGAGAQQDLYAGVLAHLLPLAEAGKLALFLNVGDHANAWATLKRRVPGLEAAAAMHTDWNDTLAFATELLAGMESAGSGLGFQPEHARAGSPSHDATGLHVFLHDDTFCAVYATNLLMRPSDVLLTKPSELAFYPIPTLFLQRVGGHEAWGAIRGAELGYGTVECADTATTLQALDMLIHEDDLLAHYCAAIPKLRELGVYHGAYNAVQHAVERRP